MVKKPWLSVLLIFIPYSLLFSQNTASVMDQILVITIDAVVSDQDGERIWGMEHSTLTISGRSVHIRLEGSNLEILANLTPYIQDNENVLLVAQGEIWISDPLTQERHHYRGMDSVPVKIGERAFFFPLGMAEGEIYNNYNLSIGIDVNLYTNIQKRSTKIQQ